jgi:hypothetical protein
MADRGDQHTHFALHRLNLPGVLGALAMRPLRTWSFAITRSVAGIRGSLGYADAQGPPLRCCDIGCRSGCGADPRRPRQRAAGENADADHAGDGRTAMIYRAAASARKSAQAPRAVRGNRAENPEKNGAIFT